MAFINGVITHRLAGEVVGDRVDAQLVLVQDVQLFLQVALILHHTLRVQVVSPARDLQTVEAPLAGEPGYFLKRKIGPLASEQGDGSVHGFSSHTFCQWLAFSALASTAASTFCTCNASANDGVGCSPAPMAVTRSTT